MNSSSSVKSIANECSFVFFKPNNNPLVVSLLFENGDDFLWFARAFLLWFMCFLFVGVARLSETLLNSVERILNKRNLKKRKDHDEKEREIEWNTCPHSLQLSDFTLRTLSANSFLLLYPLAELVFNICSEATNKIDKNHHLNGLSIITVTEENVNFFMNNIRNYWNNTYQKGTVTFDALIITAFAFLDTTSASLRVKNHVLFLNFSAWSLFSSTWLIIVLNVLEQGELSIWKPISNGLFFLAILVNVNFLNRFVSNRSVLNNFKLLSFSDESILSAHLKSELINLIFLKHNLLKPSLIKILFNCKISFKFKIFLCHV